MNVLVVPGIKCRRRVFPAPTLDEEIDIYKQVYSARFRLVAPFALERDLAARDWVQGEDFEVYDTHEEAARRLEDLAEQGVACCLIADPAWAWGDIVAAGGAGVAGGRRRACRSFSWESRS